MSQTVEQPTRRISYQLLKVHYDLGGPKSCFSSIVNVFCIRFGVFDDNLVHSKKIHSAPLARAYYNLFKHASMKICGDKYTLRVLL